MTTFGIDFGTTNSVLASYAEGDIGTVSLNEPPADWAALGFDRILPSVLAFDGNESLVGWRAKTYSGDRLEAVKRLLATDDTVEVGGRTMASEQAAALIFKHIQQRATSEGLTVDHAVVTIPANSRGIARMRTKIAAGLAGIEVAALINEPTAAAMAYGRLIGDDQSVLICDWGGGTLDVTILQSVNGVFMERASKGIQQLGGIDIDRAFAEYLKRSISGAEYWDRTSQQLFMLDVERAKVVLSGSESTNINIPGGRIIEVTRDELARVSRPLIEQSRLPIETCLRDFGSDAPIDHVVLVGGTSKIPAVRDFVAELLQCSPMGGVDPMTAVAEGASLASGILSGEVDDYDFFVSTEHALGTIVWDLETSSDKFSVLIPRNNMLPADVTDCYTPVSDFQESIRLKVIEGDPDYPLDHADNVVLKDWEILLVEPRPMSEVSLALTYCYDVDGILRVTVKDMRTEVILHDEELAFSSEQKRELVDMRKSVNTWVTGTGEDDASSDPVRDGLDAESLMLVDRVSQKILPFVDEEEQGRLAGIIADLQNSGEDSREECKRRLGRAIREHAYLL